MNWTWKIDHVQFIYVYLRIGFGEWLDEGDFGERRVVDGAWIVETVTDKNVNQQSREIAFAALFVLTLVRLTSYKNHMVG